MRAFQGALVVKNPPTNAGDINRWEFNLWVGKIPCRRAWQSTPAFLPGESHGQRRPVSLSPGSPVVIHDRSDLTCIVQESNNHRYQAKCKENKY